MNASLHVPEHTASSDSSAHLHELAERLGRLVGSHLQVLEPVAIGGMATIFKLRHTAHGGLFVAKVLHTELANKPGVRGSFRREALHAALIGGHPNAVPIFDLTEEADGLSFLTMPFIEGEDLDKLMERKGALGRTETLQLAAQITGLLVHTESHGITHCDIAPGNIRLDVFGRYRVLDFGISCSRAGDGACELMGGTPLYNSPEQIRGETLDIRSDIYSLGAILCEALRGKPLFQAASLAELREKHLRGDWRLPAEVKDDPGLAQLLHDMLVTAREKRLGSAQELSEALAGLGFESVESRAELHSPQNSDSGSRRPRLS